MATKDDMKDIARLEIREFLDVLIRETFPEILARHEATCKHGRELRRFRYIAIGVFIGLAGSYPNLIGQIQQLF